MFAHIFFISLPLHCSTFLERKKSEITVIFPIAPLLICHTVSVKYVVNNNVHVLNKG